MGIKAPRKGKSSKDNIMEITSNNNGNPITGMGHKYVGVEGLWFDMWILWMRQAAYEKSISGDS